MRMYDCVEYSWKAGYKAGLEESTEKHLQRGFDDGFIAAQIAASRIGKLTGIITAHLHIHRDKLDSRLQTDLQDILAQVGKLDYTTMFPSMVIDTKASIAPFDVADLTLLEQLESRTNTLIQSHCQ